MNMPRRQVRILAQIPPLLLLLLTLAACGRHQTMPTYEASPFGTTEDAQAVQLFTLTNSQDMRVTITNYGGIVTSLWVPDRDGVLGDVVLGYDRLEDYLLRRHCWALRKPHCERTVYAG